ncbi:AraC family transcriptional regulator [Microbacterium sp.]|uniref:helix-turn-helix transcriptional regulator n=1 Tax=Microbacterium sp. TaxID=51671 RepID=UPI002810EBED|nr:AraC family transcriptional regulator [Microbacterium sp.]
MRFRSRDLARVETTWREFVPSAVLHSVDPQRFRFDWHSEQMEAASLVRYELAAEVRSTAEPHDQLLACRVDGADARVWTDKGDVDARLPWLSDGTRVHARWDRSATVRALIFDRREAERMARQITGDDGLLLRAAEPSDAPAIGQRWERMFDYLETALADLGPADAILRAELERHALVVTLSAFATTFRDRVGSPARNAAAPATVRRALVFIEENAHRPITVDDVAAAVHISTRGLQYAFRRSLDLTPVEYLRGARLEGAHRDLRAGDPAPIATIARRWGFAHPSRFAAAYRAAYGITPAQASGRRGR